MDKFEQAKWRGEPSGNPEKGWIIDGRGNRITKLGMRKTLEKFIQLHNKEIEYLQATIGQTK